MHSSMNESEAMIGRVIVHNDGHMTNFLCIVPTTIKHQITPFQIFRPVYHIPTMQLIGSIIAQIITETTEDEMSDTGTVKFVGTMPCWHIRNAHKSHGIVDDAVGHRMINAILGRIGQAIPYGVPFRHKQAITIIN